MASRKHSPDSWVACFCKALSERIVTNAEVSQVDFLVRFGLVGLKYDNECEGAL